MRERLEEQKRATEKKVGEIKRAGGLSDEDYEAIRSVLLGIDPISAKEEQSGSHHEGYLR